MWSSRGITFVWCLMLCAVAFGMPATKTEDDSSNAPKPDPVIVEIDMLAESKPADNSKPNESVIDAKPSEVKPSEVKPSEGKPSDSPAPTTTTIFESIPLNLSPPNPSNRPQVLFDQQQDGKYNIRADLQNFVILVVPSSGNSLLDLLKRSSQRQQQQQQHQQHHNKRVHQTKHHKKYQPAALVTGKPTEGKKGGNRLDYLNGDGSEATPAGIEAFIEGRTPYHVDISSDEIIQPPAYGVRSFDSGTDADVPLVNLDENTASTSSSSAPASDTSDATLSGKSSESKPSSRNFETSPRLSKSIIIGGFGGQNPFTNFNTVLLTRPSAFGNANQHASQQFFNSNNINNRNYNNYFSRKPSVQILDINAMHGGDRDNEQERSANYMVDSTANLLHSTQTPSKTELTDLTDSSDSFNSLNVGNIDRLALAGDSSTKADSDLANEQWELTLLGAEEQCGPDRRRDSYGVCQFVPADYATT